MFSMVLVMLFNVAISGGWLGSGRRIAIAVFAVADFGFAFALVAFFGAGFFAGAFFAVGFLVVAFLATGFFAGAFFAVGFFVAVFFAAGFFFAVAMILLSSCRINGGLFLAIQNRCLPK